MSKTLACLDAPGWLTGCFRPFLDSDLYGQATASLRAYAACLLDWPTDLSHYTTQAAGMPVLSEYYA
jgi:hypothetical protein